MRAILFGGLLLVMAMPASAAPVLHVIMVADTLSNLGADVKRDQERLERFFNNSIPANMLKFTTLSDTKANREDVRKAIMTAPLKPEDCLLVYFACHGAINKAQGAVNAQFGEHLFQLHGGTKTEILKRDEVRSWMVNRKIRLVILLSDACSDMIELPMARNAQPRSAAKSVENIDNGLKKLFFELKGIVDINGSQENLCAWSDSVDGGIFTRSIVHVLEENRNNDKITWVEFYNSLKLAQQKNYEKWRGEMLPQVNNRQVKSRSNDSAAVLAKQTTQRPQAYVLPGISWGLTVEKTKDANGVIVANMTPTSPMRLAGMKLGDRITAINGKSIRTVEDYDAVPDANSLKFTVIRNGHSIEIQVKIIN